MKNIDQIDLKILSLKKTIRSSYKILLNKTTFQILFLWTARTGKTTTIINLINEYHKKYYPNIKGLKIHLNASDDRGIDVVRNQINQFVNTKSLFGHGVKFVIASKVDYMTKNAQQALRYLIQQYSTDIRFLSILYGYISKIDKALQNEFIQLCFLQFANKEIFKFLKNIIVSESLTISDNQIKNMQKNI